jgi:hypothetical protein
LNNHDTDPETDNIDVAAHMLRAMFVELQRLAVDCVRLPFALRGSVAAIGQRLDLLFGIAELLKSGEAPTRTRELGQRAKSLIFHLSAELEHLSLQAGLRLDNPGTAPDPLDGVAR